MFFFTAAEITANFIESMIGYKFICLLLNRQEKKRFTVITAVIQAFGLYILQHEQLFANYIPFVVVLFEAFAVCIGYREKIPAALTASATYVINVVAFTELGSLVVWGLFSGERFIGSIIVSEPSLIRTVYIFLIKGLQAAVYLFLKRKVKNREKLSEIFRKHWKILLPVNLISYACILVLIYFVMKEITSGLVINWLSYLLFFGMFGVIFWFYLRLRNDAERREMIEVRHEILEQSYEGLKQAMDLQAKTAHDLKNHLNILYKYMEEKDTESAKAYIEDIRQPFLAKNEEHFTGNELIDFILNVKAQEAEKRHITMKVETRIGRVGLSDRELNSLLSNLLDNAVEAAQKGEEGERFVEVWMKTVRQMFILKIRNSYTEPVQKRGAHFVTSKEDKKRHGLGLEIVRDIVEKYDGSFQVSFHEKVFQVLIEIPMEE